MTIGIEGIRVVAFHGVYPVEREQGNEFEIDIYLETGEREAPLSDRLSETVDYKAVYELVLAIMAQPVQLLETLVSLIGTQLLKEFETVERVKVRVAKMKPVGMQKCRLTFVERVFHAGNPLKD